jgi:catechol 2,3-dioxygenase-like lactoylglutathione lyase family enzyme
MELVIHVFANNLPIAYEWYTALLGTPPIEEADGTRYLIGKSSLVLSTVAEPRPIALVVPSIDNVRRRLKQSGLNLNEVLAMEPSHDAEESAAFRDPSGNLVVLANLTKLIEK